MARRSKYGRFEVANQPSDPYKHTDVAYNLDQLDMMIGGPTNTPTHGIGDDFNNPSTSAPAATNQWLSPQDPVVMTNYGARTLYNIVVGLDYNSVPLGAVFAFWRPSAAAPLPAGCVPCDGSSFTGTEKHSYQQYGITTITVPDLRGKMILGANAAVTDGTAATLPSVDAASGAPGIRGTGGTNVPRALAHTHPTGTFAISSHTHAITDHTHSIQNHYHSMEHVHAMGDHQHTFSANTGAPIPGNANSAVGGGALVFPNTNHNHAVSGLTAGMGSTVYTNVIVPVGFWAALGDGSGRTGIGTTISGTQGSSEGMFTPGLATGSATPTLSGSSGSALASTEILPQYVGLLYVVKIRKAGPLHNNVFPPGY